MVHDSLQKSQADREKYDSQEVGRELLIEEYHMDMEVMRKSHVKSMRLRWDYKPVSIDADIEQLDNHILNQNFVPVVDGRNVFIGIITRKEIIKELLKQKKDVLAKSSLAEQNVHNTQQAGRTFH